MANLQSPFGGRPARLVVLAALALAGGPAPAPAQDLYDMIFDKPSARQEREIEADRRGSPRVRMIIGGSASAPRSGELGSYRTLCVRLCDGYFFPISFAASELDFSRDQNRCEARCPGAEVRLYRHRVPGEESADMVSVAGKPYRDLPSAFDYKQAGFKRPPGCGCGTTATRERGFSVLAGGREPADELPDSVAASPDAVEGSVPVEPENRRVRVVGPKFLPDPEGAIDLRVPARTDVR